MTKLGLRAWVLILTLAPTILIGSLLGSYFTLHRFQELDDSLIERGSDIIEPLAIASEYGMVNNSREMLKRLLGVTHRRHSHLIKSIAIFDKRHRAFVSSNYHRDFDQLRLPPGSTIPKNTIVERIAGTVILRSPIHQESMLYGLKPDEPTPIIGYAVVQMNSDRALLQQHQAALAALVIVLVGVLLNLIFTFRLVKQVTEPVTEMADAIDMIRKGRLDTRVEGQLIGELDLLRSGINAMAESLNEYHLEMQQSVDQATSDLRETLEQMEVQNVELDLAKKRAQEASRVKSEFLANMSHELRTPLNGVIGFTRQLLKTPLNPNQQDYLNTIESSAQNLLTIINDVLDFSKLEAGKLQLEQMPFQLRETIYEVATLLAPNAYDKNLELAVSIQSEVPDNLLGDALRIKQILTNLVGNAIKFTDSGSITIKVLLEKDHEDRVRLKMVVRDTGIGISDEQKSALFKAFGQGDSSINRRFGGTGLGLVISQRLVKEMGGQLSFDSEANKGTTFWYSINCTKSPLPLGEPLREQLLRDKPLLVYEPQALSRRYLVEQLAQWQPELTVCESAAQWREAVETRDIHLPYQAALIGFNDRSGSLAQLSSLVQEARSCANSIIVLVNHCDPTILEAIRRKGVDISLSKPASPARLCAALLDVEKRDVTPAPKPARQPQPNQSQALSVTDGKVRAKVLAVDDNPANLKLISALLSDQVEQIATCSDGSDAVQLAQQEQFDLIMMDIQMPRMDGVTATGKIREGGLNRSTPIVAVTAHALPGEQEKLLAKGMDDYLTKPIDDDALTKLLQRWLPDRTQQPEQPSDKQRVVDWELALKRAGGREALAHEMLQMLMDSLPKTRSALEKAIEGDDHAGALHHVHKLNGACCYTGVPQLNSLANQIEGQLKRGSTLADLEPEFFELFDEMEKLRQSAAVS